jgi:hypothetical protein
VFGNSPPPTPQPVEVIAPPLPLSLPLFGVGVPENRQKLLSELKKSESRRIDLFGRDTVRAYERFQAMCRGRKLRLTVEPVAQEALKRKLRTPLVLFCDDLTAEEWVQLLQQLATADKKAEERRPGDGLYDQIVFLPLTVADQKDLTMLLGADPTAATNRFSSGTAVEKQGLVFPYNLSLRPAQGSREVKQFLENRRERPSKAIAVMLVLRQPTP